MKSLAEHQAILRDLIKGRLDRKPDDPYLAMVAESDGLAIMREIAQWWRAFQLESYCVWTSRALKQLGVFDQYVNAFFCRHAVSPFIESAGQAFLKDLSEHEDCLVASIARFELALIKVKMGAKGAFCIRWDRNPDALFRSLISHCELPPAESNCAYETYVCCEIPDLVRCVRCVDRL